ncbi:MAG TPA: glycosyltransferase family 1 protein, partial [Methyloprofundus sp.]|nr:glycosyltransferase family 1 protein [Methyloprofundus sp.]
VHSKMAQQQVIKAGFNGAIHQVPLIDYQQAMSADETRIENAMVIDLLKQKTSHGTFIIGLFGFAGQTKRSHSIFQALSELPDKLKAKLKLLIIGNDLYQSEIEAMGLSDLVVNTGYVSDTDYDQSMAICDLIINLRYPSMGETSAVQIQAMSAEKATIVSNYGWFSELADHAVHKISVAEQEVEELKQAIIKLADDESYRLSIAQQAKHYVTKYHSPAQVAQQWMDIICDRKGAL